METKLDIKFRLKQRKVKDPETGMSVQSTRNVLITMRVVYGTISMEFTTGYHVNADCWDAKKGFAIGASDGKSADEINGGLARLAKSIRDTAQLFEEKEKRPTLEEFKIAYMIIKDGLTPVSSDGQKPKSNGKKKLLTIRSTRAQNRTRRAQNKVLTNFQKRRKRVPKTVPRFGTYIMNMRRMRVSSTTGQRRSGRSTKQSDII